MTMPTLAILAGGLATRLQPISLTVPKSMAQVAGEPFLAHQLRLVKRQGFHDIVMLLGHLGEQIVDYVGDGSAFGLKVDYSYDGPTKLGTGGALRKALPMLGTRFFTLYGDSYLNVDARKIWSNYQTSTSPALMTVLHNHGSWDTSNVIFNGSHVLLHDKAARGKPGVEWIDYGFSVYSAELVQSWHGSDPFELSDLTKDLAQRGLLAGYEVTQRFYEIGNPSALAETEAYLQTLARDLP